MNFKEAEETRRKNVHLIGKKIGGRKISDVIIVPKSGELVMQIIYNHKKHKSNEHIFNRYSKFDVIVIYEDSMTSNILTVEMDPLVSVLSQVQSVRLQVQEQNG